MMNFDILLVLRTMGIGYTGQEWRKKTKKEKKNIIPERQMYPLSKREPYTRVVYVCIELAEEQNDTAVPLEF